MDISWISRVVVMKKIRILFYIILCLTVVTGCGRKETAKKEMVTTEVEMVKTTKEIVTEQNTTKREEDVMETEEEVAVEETITEETTAEKGILIALDPGHQSSSVDMSATEPNAPGSYEMKRKETGGTQGQYSGVPE